MTECMLKVSFNVAEYEKKKKHCLYGMDEIKFDSL